MSGQRHAGTRGWISAAAVAVFVLNSGACRENAPAAPTVPVVPAVPAPAALLKVAGDSQTATVKSPVAVRPAVRVEDAEHRPMPGIKVVFTVMGGTGFLTDSAPTVTTDSLGIATASAWVLGERAGANTLRVGVGKVAPLTFVAIGTAGAAAVMVANASPLGSVSAPTASPTGVRVSDAWGNAVSGVTVSFAVTAGGGTASGTSAVSDSTGVATVGEWTLGTQMGVNSLTASAKGIPDVVIMVTAGAGPPATLLRGPGDAQVGPVLSAVTTVPTVMVKDAYGNPVSRVQVAFAVTAGRGRVGLSNAGASFVWYSTTDATGTASAGGWWLGPAEGANTLMVSVPSLALPVTFTAIGHDTQCDPVPQTYTIGSRVDAALTANDCKLSDGFGQYLAEYTDRYAVSTNGTSSLLFDMSSGAYSPQISLFDAAGALVGTDRYDCNDPGTSTCPESAKLRVLVPAGGYVVGAGGFGWGYVDYYYDEEGYVGLVVGSYRMSSTSIAEDVTGCARVFVAPGLTTNQRIDSTDCAATDRGAAYNFDEFQIMLVPGASYTISVASPDFDTFLEVWDSPLPGSNSSYSPTAPLASNDDFGGSTNSELTFQPPPSGSYAIRVGTFKGNTTGAYTLTIGAQASGGSVRSTGIPSGAIQAGSAVGRAALSRQPNTQVRRQPGSSRVRPSSRAGTRRVPFMPRPPKPARPAPSPKP